MGFVVVEGLGVRKRKAIFPSFSRTEPPSLAALLNGGSEAPSGTGTLGSVSACFASLGSRHSPSGSASTSAPRSGWRKGEITFTLTSPPTTEKHGRQQRVVGLGLASLTASVAQQINEARLRSTFVEISGTKRCFDSEDLARYAMNNGLPVRYVKPFIDAAEKSAESGIRLPHLSSGRSCITYEKFSKYVRMREDALMQMFQTLDVNGSGSITARELEIAFSHLRIKCPDSKCVYKCKKQVVHDFVARVAKDKKESFKFNDFRNFFLLLPENSMLMDYYMSARDSSPCDIGGCVVLHKKTDGNPMGHLLAGAMSGAVSRTATAPLETLRIMAMTGSAPQGGTLRAAHEVVQSSGWRGLFRGNGVNVMRSAPQKALDFFAFDGFKRVLSKGRASDSSPAQMGPGTTLVAAGLAGATSSTLLYPLEVLRSRLTCDTTGAYKGVADAFRKVVAAEGVGALYAGVGPSIAAIVPEAAITYGMFDLLKRSYSEMRGIPEPSVVVSLAFGVSSAFMGQVVAYPLETISRRMQVSQEVNLSAAKVAMGIIQKEGVQGLYGGIRPSMMKVLPMAVLSFGTYEFVRTYLNQMADKMEEVQVRKECTEKRFVVDC